MRKDRCFAEAPQTGDPVAERHLGRLGLVGSGGSIENAAIFLANPHEAHQIAAELLVAINGIIGDCVIVSTELCSLITCLAHGGSYQVYRMWLVWNKKIYVTILPLICIAGITGMLSQIGTRHRTQRNPSYSVFGRFSACIYRVVHYRGPLY